jgi:ribonucleoside-triphosphate reductase
VHGYVAGKHERCPSCNAVSEVYSRVVGYLRPVNQWNEGKVEEFKQRRTFRIEQGAEQSSAARAVEAARVFEVAPARGA